MVEISSLARSGFVMYPSYDEKSSEESISKHVLNHCDRFMCEHLGQKRE